MLADINNGLLMNYRGLVGTGEIYQVILKRILTLDQEPLLKNLIYYSQFIKKRRLTDTLAETNFLGKKLKNN